MPPLSLQAVAVSRGPDILEGQPGSLEDVPGFGWPVVFLRMSLGL